MYDCIDVESRPYLPAYPGITHPDRRWRRHNRLYLAARRDETDLLLNHAFSTAASLGFATEKLADGRLLILDIDLETALLMTRRFPALLVRFEPARIY